MDANRFRFRAWNPHAKEMLTELDDPAMPFLLCNGRLHIEYDFTDVTDDLILMQSTGLCDSNGVEIFEGDVVEWVRHNWYCPGHPDHKQDVRDVLSVYWCDRRGGMCVSCQFKHGGGWSGLIADGLDDNRASKCTTTVIGNIHANPELAEREE